MVVFCITAASGETHHVNVCSNMEVALNKCADDEIIKVKSASHIKSINCNLDKPVCTSNTTLEKITEYCDGSTTCTIPVNDEFLEDPCINQVEKCVIVVYKCGENGECICATKFIWPSYDIFRNPELPCPFKWHKCYVKIYIQI